TAGLAAVIEPKAAPVAADMGAQQTRPVPERDEFTPQLLAWPMPSLSRVGLERNNPVLHKPFGPLLQLDELVRERKVHRHLRVDAKHPAWPRTSSCLPALGVKPASFGLDQLI